MKSVFEAKSLSYRLPQEFHEICTSIDNLLPIDEIINKFLNLHESDPELCHELYFKLYEVRDRYDSEEIEFIEAHIKECLYFMVQKYKNELDNYLLDCDDFEFALNNEIYYIKDCIDRAKYFADFREDKELMEYYNNSHLEYLNMCIELVDRIKGRGTLELKKSITIPNSIPAKILILKELGIYELLRIKTDNNKANLEKLVSYIIGHETPDTVGRYFSHLEFEEYLKVEKHKNTPYTKPAIKEMKRVLEDCEISLTHDYTKI